MSFDARKFLKEALILFLISNFIFVLACISLFAQMNDYVLSVIAAEPAGYVGYFDARYDASNNDTIKRIVGLLEEDTADLYDKQIYVLDKETGAIISSTGEVPNAARKQLTSSVNEKLIYIDESTCNVTNFDHYKVLVKASAPYLFDDFVDSLVSFAITMLRSFVVALALLALVHRFFPEGSNRRLVATIALILAVVFSFAGKSLRMELTTIDLARQYEESNLKLDVEAICQSPDVLKLSDQEQLLEVANYIAKSSQTLKEVTASADLQGKPADAASIGQILDTFQVVGDDTAVNNFKMNSYIEALLILLLAFMVVFELQNRARIEKKLQTSGNKVALAADDHRMRTTLMVIGVSTSAFSVVNVLRIRQMVMLYWTDNIAVLISTVFTCAMIASVVGSSLSSVVLKFCKSVKTYSVFALVFGIVGAFMCGISSNIVIFFAGLMVFNAAKSQIMMLGDFYSALISDVNRKDACQVEFASSTSLGQVIGNIIGGVISVVLSFAVVQLIAAVCLGASLFFCLSFKKNELAVRLDEIPGGKSESSSMLKMMIRGDVLMYSVCIVIPASIMFNLVQYKLPLDVATLGLSTLVISLAKTTEKVIRVYISSLYHVVSRRLSLLTHLAAYVVLCGVVALFYMLNNSLVGMIASVAVYGVVSGAGFYVTTKAFREIETLANTPESDRMVALDLVRRVGDTVSPTLLSIFGSGATLPVMIIVAPLVYLARAKAKAKERR